MKNGIKLLIFTIVCSRGGQIGLAAATAGAEFLTMSHNANQLSAGPAAHLKGIDAVMFNPAAGQLAGPFTRELASSYFSLAEGAYFATLQYQHQVSEFAGTFGTGLSYFSYGAIDTFDSDGNAAGQINPFDMAAHLNYSRRFFQKLTLGGNAKLVYQKLASRSAQTMAFDLGAHYQQAVAGNNLAASVSFINMGADLRFVQSNLVEKSEQSSEVEGTRLPAALLASVTYSLQSFLPRGLDLALGPVFEYHLDDYTSAGATVLAAYRFAAVEVYTLASYQASDAENNFNAGAGLSFSTTTYRIDLSSALRPGDTLGNVYQFTAKASFRPGQKKVKKKSYRSLHSFGGTG